MSETIILIVDDLMFLPKLERLIRHEGYTPLAATNETALYQALFQSPVLAIVDLFSRGYAWEPLLQFIKREGAKGAHIPVVGFGPHVDLALRERALAAGCEAVVGRSAIVSQLPRLIKKHRWQINTNRCQEKPPPLLRQGIELLNQGEYFEAHELIEEAWVAESHSVRVMYQGILQIAVACYHVEQKNWRGAMKMLARGLPKIRQFAPVCMGLNLAQLTTEAEAMQTELQRVGEAWEGEFTAPFPTVALPVS